MPSVLISGCSGFIGINFIRFSSLRDLRCVSLRNTEPADISFSGIDTVLHLAAIVHQANGISAGEYYRVNRDLTINFAWAARSAGVKQFVFLSTSKVYGDEGSDFPCKEDSACNPTDDYGRSKYEAETGLLKLNCADFIVTILRTPVVYGKGMKANMLNLLHLVMTVPMIPLGNISNKRSYTYIENLIGYIDRVINLRAPGIFIAMDNEPVSTTEMVQIMADASGLRRKIFAMPSFLRIIFKHIFPDHWKRLYGSFILDNVNTRRELSYTPPFSTLEGITKTVKNL